MTVAFSGASRIPERVFALRFIECCPPAVTHASPPPSSVTFQCHLCLLRGTEVAWLSLIIPDKSFLSLVHITSDSSLPGLWTFHWRVSTYLPSVNRVQTAHCTLVRPKSKEGHILCPRRFCFFLGHKFPTGQGDISTTTPSPQARHKA